MVMNESIVAMLGFIMPLPFAMPPILHVFPPMETSTATSLGIVSVVMMASAADADPL